MCGIVGWNDFNKNLEDETDVIRAMAKKLSHRGPDESGFWISGETALGHRRLTVVDPEGGKQPMLRERNGNIYALVYNGELYNTGELRQELKLRGCVFEGWSDTEVLINAYMTWGRTCLEKINGIFAFAVWDSEKKTLFLARDRIGVKPLFYSLKGSSFIFGSEIKAILEHPAIEPKLCREGLAEIFAIGPARTPGHGVFDGISELKPGHWMEVTKEGITIKQYWKLRSHTHGDDFEKTTDQVRELVYDSVKRQLISDVPLCTLLSGGLDSGAITAIACRELRSENKDLLNTFSIDYVENDRYFTPSDFQPNADAPWAKMTSEYLGTRHHICMIDTPELAEALFPALVARDLPGMTDVDASLLLFSRWIKGHATVGLSGECADEVFGGYPWFYRQSGSSGLTFPWSQCLNERWKLYSRELLDGICPEKYIAGRYEEAVGEVPRLEGEAPEDARMRELFYLNLTRWMPTLLDRKDRMSMACGLELRVPFCDHRLVEYMWNVPWEMKYYRSREKGLLRHALTGLLPDEILWRKKSPYPKTHNPSYLDAMRMLMLDILDDPASPLLPFLNINYVRELALSIKKDTNIPWFGQLMNAPQILAYLVQIDFWLREYRIAVY